MNLLRLRADLTRDEGKKLSAYKDTNGFWTIGVGHLLGSEQRMTTITEDECTALLDFDIDLAEAAVKRVVDVPNSCTFLLLDDVRQRALVNMMFNRGEKHFRESTTITPAIMQAMKLIGGQDLWPAVSDAIMASPWAKQIGKRAERLAYMLKFGKDPA